MSKKKIQQQEIDQLLKDSQDQKQQKKQKLKKLNNKPSKQIQDNYDDDFFESQVKQKTKPFNKQSKSSTKIQQNTKNKLEYKVISKHNKQPIQVEQENYLHSDDFQSNPSQYGDQTTPHQQSKNNTKSPYKQQEKQDDYQMEQHFQSQNPTSRVQSQAELVQSGYTQSRDQYQANQQIDDNVDQDIQTVRSSHIMSKVMNDDDIPQDQSQYIESTRINQQQFKKKPQLVKQPSNNNTKSGQNKPSSAKPTQAKAKNDPTNIDMKKKKVQPQVLNLKTDNKKQTIQSKKQIPQPKRLSVKNTQQIRKGQKQSKKDLNQQLLTPSQIQQNLKQKLAQIQAQKKKFEDKKNEKLKIQQDKAKAQYEQMKTKQEQRKQKNKKLLQEQKKAKNNGKLGGTIMKGDKQLVLDAEKIQLNLTDSKIKQLAQQKQKQKNQKAEQKIVKELKQKRKNLQKQIKQKQESQNNEKLKRLQKQQQNFMQKTKKQKQQLKIKRQKGIVLNKVMQENKIKQKMNEKRQDQAPQVRKIRQQISQLRVRNEQKQRSIDQLDEQIRQLKKILKQTQLISYNQGQEQQYKISKQQNNEINKLGDQQIDSQLTSIQKFVRLFDQCQNTGQIFNLIDQNKDQFISLEQIKSKITDILINNIINQSQSQSHILQQHKNSLNQNQNINSLVQQVFNILDKNSDGNITKSQFSFIIDSQIKKAQQYRKLTNNITHKNPLDIQASILDMKEKIKYMQKICSSQLNNGKLQDLQEKYQKYLSKHQVYQRKIIYGKGGKDKKKKKQDKQDQGLEEDITNDKMYFLTQQVQKLRLKKDNQKKMLEKIRKKQQENIKQKNIQLTQKVQQNIKLNEQLYRKKSQIQEYQLRYLSTTKIQQNRHRYMTKKSQQKQAYQEAIQRAKQYQTKILNPTKQIKFGTYANEVKYLAAVIMIQRNFRKRKAMREKKKLQKER